MIRFRTVNKFKGRKRYLPIFLFLIVGVIEVWSIISYAQIKTINADSPKIVYLSPIPTITPTLTPSPIPSPIPTPTPTKTPAPSPTPVKNTSTSDYLLRKVNEYRKSLGLYEVASDSNTCEFAAKRAQEVSVNFNHDGFSNFPYPKYSRVTENIAMDENYTDVVNQWINSSVHAEIMRQDTPYVCIQSVGNYYAYEGWKP